MERKKVLVAEDDLEIANLLKIHLKDLSADVDIIQEGDKAYEEILKNRHDLIILDLMLPGMDGIEVCQKARARDINTPILILTAKAEEIDRVLGLEVGADDYITKPFSVREFIARVKAIFRRTQMIQKSIIEQTSKIIKRAGLVIDIDKRKVLVNDQKVELSPKEFELLVLMASNPGRSYDRTRLLSLIWGYDFEGYEHTVNSHINRLRSKIEPDMNEPVFILTSWGVGYRFNEEIN